MSDVRNCRIVCGAALAAFLGVSALSAQEPKEKPKMRPLALADDLVGLVPDAWKAQEVKGAAAQFRRHQLVLPRAKDDDADGQFVVFHFGAGGGGGLKANLQRWYGMVEPGDGKKPQDVAKPMEIAAGDDVKITWIDLAGTYLDRPSPMSQQVTRRPGYRLFAVYVDGGKDGPYYVRAWGPERTMQSHREAFEAFLKSLGKGQ